MVKKIAYILFDAANTLIHKPELWSSFQSVFSKYGHILADEKLKLHHKILSETIIFPDRTTKEFYFFFNGELLMSLGIVPTKKMLDDLFQACNYLPWSCFEDAYWLKESTVKMGILSNFNNNLPDIIIKLFGNIFTEIIVSESVEVRKPDLKFYTLASEKIGISPTDILYVGDSLKLDIIPATQAGFNCNLIDRNGIYLNFENRISSLNNLNDGRYIYTQ